MQAGRRSPFSMYSEAVATMEGGQEEAYNQDDATGFIALNASASKPPPAKAANEQGRPVPFRPLQAAPGPSGRGLYPQPSPDIIRTSGLSKRKRL